VALRGKWQGKQFWETVDAGLAVEYWQRLTKIPTRDRAAVFRASVLCREGTQLYARGRYRAAGQKTREAMAIYPEVLGEEPPCPSTCGTNQAANLSAQGRYAEALTLARRTLAFRLEVLGDHPETAVSYDTLASCLYSHGHYAKALPLFEKALLIRC